MLRDTYGADAFCIALVILPICIAPTVISERLKPQTYPTPKPAAVVLKHQDRLPKQERI